MSEHLAMLEAAALKLSPEERVLLADHLLASVDAASDIEEAWAAEIEQRLAEIEAGGDEFVTLETALQRARQALS